MIKKVTRRFPGKKFERGKRIRTLTDKQLEWLKENYAVCYISAIAKAMGLCTATVDNLLNRYDIPRRGTLKLPKACKPKPEISERPFIPVTLEKREVRKEAQDRKKEELKALLARPIEHQGRLNDFTEKRPNLQDEPTPCIKNKCWCYHHGCVMAAKRKKKKSKFCDAVF